VYQTGSPTREVTHSFEIVGDPDLNRWVVWHITLFSTEFKTLHVVTILPENVFQRRDALRRKRLGAATDLFRPGVTNLFAIAGHFVSYSGPHNFLVILWNLLKTKKLVRQHKQTTNESNNRTKFFCGPRVRHPWFGRNQVTYSFPNLHVVFEEGTG